MIGCEKESEGRKSKRKERWLRKQGGEQKERRKKMEERIEKHTLSSGQDIERRETNTSTLVKREGGSFGKRHACVSKLPDR